MNKKTDLTGTSKGYKIFSVIILVAMVLFFLFPLYWIVTGSFKDRIEITAREPIWFPMDPTVENYAKLFDNPAFLWLFNIIFISAAAMILTCITASLAGYALGKKRFIGRGVLFTIIICAMALPKQVIVIPLAQLMTFLHLKDTLWAVILPTVGWPFGVFLMKQFSESIPTEILEAARMDRASEFAIIRKIMLPMAGPSLAMLALVTFIGAWNDYFWPLILTTNETVRTLPVGITMLRNVESGVAYNVVMAGNLLMLLPILIVYLLAQKQIIKAFSYTGVK